MIILCNLNYDPAKHGSYHNNSGEIITVPEDTLSMREIYNRFRNGEPLEVNLYDPQYSDNEYQDIDLSMLDPVEVMELTQKYNDIRKKHEERIADEQKRKEQLEQYQANLRHIVRENVEH